MNTTNVLTVGFCGYAGSGKDTAAGQLVREGWHRIAFGDKLKQHLLVIDPIVPLPPGFKPTHRHLSKVVATHGWDWAKRELAEVRRLLQAFGTDVGRELDNNLWVNLVDRDVAALDGLRGGAQTPVVVTDVRFADEQDWTKARNGLLIRVDRPGVGPVNAHKSEAVDRLSPDVWIVNDGTPEQLHDKVRAAIQTRS